jgi:RecA-family ATPase
MVMQQPRGAAPPAKPKRMTLAAVSAGVQREPDRLLIYGTGGIGKTTFLAEMDRPIFIDTQAGTRRLDVARFPTTQVWQDVLDALDTLANEQHPYRTVAVDLLDDVEQLIWARICQRDGKDNIEAYGYGKGYRVALVEWRSFMSKLERLRSEKQMQVGLAAHVIVQSFKNPEGEDYDRYQLQLDKLASGLLRGWCDNVLFARQQVGTKTDKKLRTRGVSSGARVIHTVETAAYYAKNRDSLPDTLPLDFAAYAEAVAAAVPADPEELRSEIAKLLSYCTDAEYLAKAQKLVEESGDDANRLVRILNKLREKLAPQIESQEQQKTAESSHE